MMPVKIQMILPIQFPLDSVNNYVELICDVRVVMMVCIVNTIIYTSPLPIDCPPHPPFKVVPALGVHLPGNQVELNV